MRCEGKGFLQFGVSFILQIMKLTITTIVAGQNATIRLAGVGGQEVLLLLAGQIDRCSKTWS
jgi:hypothetical protein